MAKKIPSSAELEKKHATARKFLSNKVISSGSIFLDLFINPRMPGLPTGKVICVAGRPQAGKSTLGYLTARALLDSNKNLPAGVPRRRAIIIDIENGSTPEQRLLYDLPDTREDYTFISSNDGPWVLNYVEALIREYQGREEELFIFMDGMPQLSFVPVDELNDYSSTAAVALGANKLKVFFRENKSLLAGTNICLMMSTYITHNINKKNKYDADYVLSGGSYLEYGSDIIMEMTKMGQPRDTEAELDTSKLGGNNTLTNLGRFRDIRIKFHKNKFSQDKIIEMILCTSKEEGYRTGFLDLAVLFDYAKKQGIVPMKGGGYIQYNGGNWQGATAFKKALADSILCAQGLLATTEPGVDGLFAKVYNEVHAKILAEHRIKPQ